VIVRLYRYGQSSSPVNVYPTQDAEAEACCNAEATATHGVQGSTTFAGWQARPGIQNYEVRQNPYLERSRPIGNGFTISDASFLCKSLRL
jgi:hypothetical protein